MPNRIPEAGTPGHKLQATDFQTNKNELYIKNLEIRDKFPQRSRNQIVKAKPFCVLGRSFLATTTPFLAT